jgi:hypothetical protein
MPSRKNRMMHKKKDKYWHLPERRNVNVGEYCSLAECCRQVRKAAEKDVMAMTWSNILGAGMPPIKIPELECGNQYSGLNNSTGEYETFEVCSVAIMQVMFSTMKRIK